MEYVEITLLKGDIMIWLIIVVLFVLLGIVAFIFFEKASYNNVSAGLIFCGLGIVILLLAMFVNCLQYGADRDNVATISAKIPIMEKDLARMEEEYNAEEIERIKARSDFFGFRDYLLKPVEKERIEVTISKLEHLHQGLQ